MPGSNLPTRRVWDVMDQVQSNLVFWLMAVICMGLKEWNNGAFNEDPF